MGLASSQARLLSLTARQHSLEYEAQKLEAQKLQLANDSDEVYNTYLEALDATKIQYKVVDTDGSTSYVDATFTKLKEAGFLFKVGDTICTSFDEVKEALSDQGIVELTASDSYSLLTTLVSEGYVILMQVSDDATSGYEYIDGQIRYTNPSYDSDNDEDGDGVDDNEQSQFLYYDLDEEDDDGTMYAYYVYEDTSVSTSTKLQEVSDEVGLKKAEAQYEADMNKIDAKDSQYDTELSQLETERDAIKEEIETLNTVAGDNVERTFKIFS